METLEVCPICACSDFVLHVSTKDFLVTQQGFKIVTCKACGLKYTNPRPTQNGVGEYYKFNTSVRDVSKVPFGSIAQKSDNYKILRLVSSFFKTGTFLDVGYETKSLMDLFKFAKWNVSGVSLEELIKCDFGDLNEQERAVLNTIETSSVGVICLWHSLEKVADTNSLLLELKRILKPKGIIILAASNPTSFDANYYKEYWEGYNLPRNVYHFSPKDIDAIFLKYNMKVFRTLPLVYESYSNSFWSEINKSGKASCLKAFLIGLQSNIAAIKSGKSNSAQIYLISK